MSEPQRVSSRVVGRGSWVVGLYLAVIALSSTGYATPREFRYRVWRRYLVSRAGRLKKGEQKMTTRLLAELGRET